MSKHWNPRSSDKAGQWDRHRWSVRPKRRAGRERWRFSWGELRLMVLGGVFVGLAATFYPHRPETAGAWSGDAFVVTGSVRVIDGDTFDYAGMRVRIADIDTPEMRGRCAYETELAARATDRLGTLLGEGPFELHPIPDGRDEDQYGRKLRIVTRDGRSVGDMLVAEGLARTWTGRREPWCA